MPKLGSDSLKERNTVTKGKVNHLLNVTPGANITSKVCHCQKNSNASNSECSVEWQQHHREGRQQLGLSGKFFFYVREVTDLQEWDLCQILPSF